MNSWMHRLEGAREMNRQAMRQTRSMLQQVVLEGITKYQFEVFRANYIYRTTTSVYCVAATVAAALAHDPPDIKAAKRTTLQVLLDELGGEFQLSHLELLERSLNTLALHRFSLAPLEGDDFLNHLIPEARGFRIEQRDLFASSDYCRVLGASYAQESAADGMLRMLQDALILPLLSGVPKDVRTAVMEYFDAHLSEDQGSREIVHAQEALQSISPYLSSADTAEKVCSSAELCFAMQSRFFLALATKMLTMIPANERQ